MALAKVSRVLQHASMLVLVLVSAVVLCSVSVHASDDIVVFCSTRGALPSGTSRCLVSLGFLTEPGTQLATQLAPHLALQQTPQLAFQLALQL